MPTATALPSTVARTPLPLTASKSAASFSASPSAFARLTTARASGCSLPVSAEPAQRSSSLSAIPPRGATSVTSGWPFVMVPVLSKTMVRTSFMVWMASPERIRMPFWAPMPLPTISAVGVARPSAHGQAITITATPAKTASESAERSGRTHGSTPCVRPATCRSAPGKTSHAAKVSSASAITTGTKKAVTRSANACIGTREPWACCTILTTCERNVSLPTRVASMRSTPSWLIVAPMTSSPARLVTGMLSPVAMDSSTELRPSSTFPSVGTFSPGRTTITSPTCTWSTGTSTSCPSRSTRAARASISSSLRMAWLARPLALASM